MKLEMTPTVPSTMALSLGERTLHGNIGLTCEYVWLQVLGYQDTPIGDWLDLSSELVKDKWISFKLRYYPSSGDVEIYVGVDKETPTLRQTAKGVYAWDSAKSGTRTLGFSLAPVKQVGDTTYFDNLSIKTYGYSDVSSGIEGIEVGLEGITINKGISREAWILCAAYGREGILQKSSIQEIKIPTGISKFEVPEKFLIPSGSVKLKCFVWEKETLKPFLDVIEY